MTTSSEPAADVSNSVERSATVGELAGDPTTLTLSQERLVTGTQWVETGRLTVRRRVVTETVAVQVTLRREELVVDEVPAATGTATTAPTGSDDGGHGQHDPLVIVLRREVPDIGVRIEPYEQVRVVTDYVTTEQSVQAQVRREELDYQQASPPPSAR